VLDESRLAGLGSKPAYYWRQTTFIQQHLAGDKRKESSEDQSPTRAKLNTLSEEERKAADLRIIERTFADVKKFIPGTEKKNSAGVTIKRVFDLQPFFEFASNRTILTIFDHEAKENMTQIAGKKLPFNSTLLMKSFAYEGLKGFAIYSKTNDHSMITVQKNPQAETQVTLGRGEYQFKREYTYIVNPEEQLTSGMIVYVRGNAARYLRPRSILKLNKKKNTARETGIMLPMKINLDARGYTKDEINYKNKRFEEIQV